jgi:hypothetical protein
MQVATIYIENLMEILVHPWKILLTERVTGEKGCFLKFVEIHQQAEIYL